jgi:hypothetical protein
MTMRSAQPSIQMYGRGVARGFRRSVGLRLHQAGAGVTGNALIDPEHGAALKQVGTPWHGSSYIRIRAPCGERPILFGERI